MICKNCGKELAEGEIFCLNCGFMYEEEPETKVEEQEPTVVQETPIQQEKHFCPNCGAPNNIDAVFCGSCGTSFIQQGTESQSVSNVAGINKNTTLKKKKSKEHLIIGVAVLFLIMVGAGVFGLMKKTGAKSNRIMYLKDGSLYQSSLRKMEPQEVDDDIYEDESGFSTYSFQYSEDYKYLFYPKFKEDGTDLYYIQINKKNAEPTKVASDISGFDVLKDNSVIYETNDYKLYKSDLQDKEKIATDVNRYFISKDEKKLLWRESDTGRMFVQEMSLKEDKEKLDSDVTEITSVSENFESIVYKKDTDLYIMKNTSDKTKIASDVEEVAANYWEKDPQIIYSTVSTAEVSMMDFIEDDLAEADQNIVEPRIEDYQKTTYVDSYWGQREKTETDEAYYDKRQEYEEKSNRDYLREQLRNNTIALSEGEIFIYDSVKDESTSIASGYISDIDNRGSMEGSITGLYSCLLEDEIESYKFSDVYNTDTSVNDLIQNGIAESMSTYLYVGTSAARLFNNSEYDLSYIWQDESSKNLYGVRKELDEGIIPEEGELISISCAGNNLGEITELYSDVYGLKDIIDGNIYYYKDADMESQSAELYCNDTKIDDDVTMDRWIESLEDIDGFLYYKDWEDEYSGGTLKLYDGKTDIKIGNDIRDYFVIGNKNIVVFDNYSEKYHTGDLHLYNGKELVKIDSDVSGLIKIK